MKKSLLLIRHAQSANNALPETQRVPDPALTSLGTRQAALLADALVGRPIAELFASPFRRSLDTTLPVSMRLGIQPVIRADIYEQGGCYSGYEIDGRKGEPGMNRAELAAAYTNWGIDPAIGQRGWNIGRKYETCEEVQLRAKSVIQWLAENWMPVRTDSLAALIIHADFKRLLIEEMLGSNSWPGCDQPIWNTSISQLDWSKDGWSMVEWNTVDHLPLDMQTC